MRVSTKGRYALRVMIDLACHDKGQYIALKTICERQSVTIKYLEQIVSTLCKAGLVVSARGAGGGYRLAKAAEEYTAGDILRVTESSMAPVSCVEPRAVACHNKPQCSTFAFWQGLNETITQYVDSITLAQLAQQWKEKRNTAE